MAKHKVGVLEASVPPDSSAPQVFCGRALAEMLIEKQMVRKLGKRLIQVLEGTAREAVEWAKKAREEAIKLWERYQLRLGVGNLVPFSRPTDPGQHFHYEIPRANDKGIRRWGFLSSASAKDEKLRTRTIRVSARPQSHLCRPFIQRTQPNAPALAGSF